MNSQMTERALAGKCGCRGASGFRVSTAASRRPVCCNNPARASKPKPLPAWRRKSRRVAKTGEGGAKRRGNSISRSSANRLGLVDVDELVQTHQDLAKV